MWQVVINGPGYFDTRYELPGGSTTLGRGDDNDIVLSGDLVSRRHARLEVGDEEVTVEDLGSRNGVRVNGEKLTARRSLKLGDIVIVGENTLAVRQSSAAEGATTEVDSGSGGVRHISREVDFRQAVVVARNVNENIILQALDNVMPFRPVAAAPLVEEKPSVPYASMAMLFKAAEKLATARTLPEFLNEAVDRLLELAQGTAAVVLVRHANGTLVPASVRRRGDGTGEVPVSDTIIEEALRKKSALWVADVKDDVRFARRESVSQSDVDHVLCVPLGPPPTFVGVLYVTSNNSSPAFIEPLVDLGSAVAHLIYAGFERFRTRERPGEGRLRLSLERFFAPGSVESQLQGLLKRGAFRTLEERAITVLYAQVVGFAGAKRKLSPNATAEVLNDFHRRIAGLVFSYEGALAKFMGESAEALFGVLEPREDDAVRAVRAAISLQQEWRVEMSRRSRTRGLALRIGLDTGRVMSGLLGPEERLELTAVGEAVRQAQWLAASAAPDQVLITGKTLAATGARFDVNPLGPRDLVPETTLPVFEVVGEDPNQTTLSGRQ